jgi:mannosyltransferase OCH1-like enzyme
MFKVESHDEMKRLIRQFEIPFSEEQFMKALEACTEKHGDFMLIDNVETDRNKRVRHNFDTYIQPLAYQRK